ncbi:MAG: hypothetical protein CMJ25_02520 [Phycisphaerae bacterium]|nr:hypothetical protein [Phycisphaerae bacterium]
MVQILKQCLQVMILPVNINILLLKLNYQVIVTILSKIYHQVPITQQILLLEKMLPEVHKIMQFKVQQKHLTSFQHRIQVVVLHIITYHHLLAYMLGIEQPKL